MSFVELIAHPLRTLQNLRHYDYSPGGLSPLPPAIVEHFPCVERVLPFNKWVSHTGRQDRRFPRTGLLTWDEATLMHNYGLKLRGRRMLEIGCWVGWSTVVVGLSGVDLTVIDPVLDGEPQGEACREAVASAGLGASVTLVPGFSPQAVTALGERGERWSAFFIDGNHEGEAPLHDARACLDVAEDDAIMLFHDAIQPNICAVLHWLKLQGWQCGMHYTSQFIGVAWRGSLQPLSHVPDPRIDWEWLVPRKFPHCAEFARV